MANITPVQQSSPLSKLLRTAVMGLVIGNGYWTYQNQQNHTQSVATINKLSTKLLKEETTNKEQATTMSQLNEALNQSKTTIGNLGQQFEQSKATVQSLMSQLSQVNIELNSKITLDQIAKVASLVSKSTVMVEGEKEMVNPFTGEKEKEKGNGSGVVIVDNLERRFIMTNAHVTEDAAMIRDMSKDGVYHIKMFNGNDFEKIVEFDAAPLMLSNGKRAESSSNDFDISLLAIPADVNLPKDIGVKMRDVTIDPLQAGEPLMAIGNPYGIRDYISFGIAANVNRNVGSKEPYIETDAPIHHGNSGGGLFDMQGRLVGINRLSPALNIGAAIRIDTIKKVLESWGIPVMNAQEKEAFAKIKLTK